MRYAPRSSVTADDERASAALPNMMPRAMACTWSPTTGSPASSRTVPEIAASFHITTVASATRSPSLSVMG